MNHYDEDEIIGTDEHQMTADEARQFGISLESVEEIEENLED